MADNIIVFLADKILRNGYTLDFIEVAPHDIINKEVGVETEMVNHTTESENVIMKYRNNIYIQNWMTEVLS